MTGQSTGNGQAWRVFLVEDNAVVRRGIHLLVGFEPDLVVCGEAEDADEAFAQICDLRPDLAIVDLALKESSGLDLIPRLHVECPQVRILVLSMHDQPRWIELALQAGAEGYLTKDESPDQLIRAIRQVLEGKRFLSQRGLARLGGKCGVDWLMPSQAGNPSGPLEHPPAPRTDNPPASPPDLPLPLPPRSG